MESLTLDDFIRELQYAVETQTNITLEPNAARRLLELLFMKFGPNYRYAYELLNLAKEIASLNEPYLNCSGPLPEIVLEWRSRARDLVAKMDN